MQGGKTAEWVQVLVPRPAWRKRTDLHVLSFKTIAPRHTVLPREEHTEQMHVNLRLLFWHLTRTGGVGEVGECLQWTGLQTRPWEQFLAGN